MNSNNPRETPPLGGKTCEFCGSRLSGSGQRCINCDSDQNFWHAPGTRVVRDLATILLLPILFTIGVQVYKNTQDKAVAESQLLESSSEELEALVDILGRMDTDQLAYPCFRRYSDDPEGHRTCEGELFDRWKTFDATFLELSWRIETVPLESDAYDYWVNLVKNYWGTEHQLGWRYQILSAMLGSGGASDSDGRGLAAACAKTVTSGECVRAQGRVYEVLRVFKPVLKTFSCHLVRDSKARRVAAIARGNPKTAQQVEAQLKHTSKCGEFLPLPSGNTGRQSANDEP